MVLSDTLSRRPDLCLDDDTDNDNMILLPDDMFISLLDESLQHRILDSTDLDGNAANTLKFLLDTGPTSLTMGHWALMIGLWKNRTDKMFSFIRTGTIFLKTLLCDAI